ncbi:MAG: branched-chain amino acid ABC transporter permease [Hadesarchaea archaeon]|nr:MAG: branched-chain amino acid ABC transporter permease [Hadesarchaea archaeon]
MIQEILINGAATGGVFALLAVGFSLIFGVARIINLAHTAFCMLAAYSVYAFSTIYGLNFYLSVVLAILLTVFVGSCAYRLCFHPIREHELAVMVVSVALGIIIQQLMVLIFGGTFRSIPSFAAGYLELLGVRILKGHLLVLGIALFSLFLVWLMLTKTKLGIAIRATAQDREMASLVGINVGWMCMITMAMAVALAALAGTMVGPLITLSPWMWLQLLVVVLAVVILGGLGSLKGSLLAAFLLGYTETAVVHFVPMGSFLRGVASLIVMLIVLLVRPEGLFGISFEEERL